jgi:hypothetical protein
MPKIVNSMFSRHARNLLYREYEFLPVELKEIIIEDHVAAMDYTFKDGKIDRELEARKFEIILLQGWVEWGQERLKTLQAAE